LVCDRPIREEALLDDDREARGAVRARSQKKVARFQRWRHA
jgi:hypothetical protein